MFKKIKERKLDQSAFFSTMQESCHGKNIIFNKKKFSVYITVYFLSRSKPLLKHTSSEVEKVFRVNVFSQFWTVLEFLKDFIKQVIVFGEF